MNLAQEKTDWALGVSTRAVHGEVAKRPFHPHNTLTTPIYQTAPYTFENTADLCAYMDAKFAGRRGDRREYARYGNPTVIQVEKRLAVLEHADAAILFPTGMTAITHVLLSILPTGSHIIYTDDCYSKTRDFVTTFLKRLGITATKVPMGDYGAMADVVRPNTRIIVSESPTNPYLRIADLEKIAAIGKQYGRIKTIIDATFATPVNINPLDFGIDLVIHSATKYLSGHNDVMAGVVLGEAGLLQALRQSQGVLGGVIDPHAAYLVERGLKTLELRVRQQNQTAQVVAEYLETHPKVARVWYPGLASHPDHAVAAAQMRGFGGVVSFEIAPQNGENPLDAAARFIDSMKIPLIAPSLGGVESLIMQPALVSYYDLSTEERLTIGIKDNLVRFAIGVENTADILADLEQALERI